VSRRAWLAAAIGILLAGCASGGAGTDGAACPPGPVCERCVRCTVAATEGTARYEVATWTDLPGWDGAALAPSVQAFVTGCAALESAPRWTSVCQRARRVPPGDEAAARAFVESAFRPYRVRAADGAEEGFVSGYYEPILRGRRAADARFSVPVFGVPDDLVVVDLGALHPELAALRPRGRLDGRRLVPYDTRREIEARASGGGDPRRPGLTAPVLLWVDDPVELFFLQVQGSGQVELETGERIRLGFAEHNGHPYRSPGRWLIEQGALTAEQASMQTIKAWAAANPARVREALEQNPRYVFFRELPSTLPGPLGTLGVPLTAGHSIAVDRRSVPLGAPVFLSTRDPRSRQPLQRLMVAQDTGGAIIGALRVDFYWGTGDEAGERAGSMKEAGRLWLLWPRDAGPPPDRAGL
jgi:membrane-bound lytic murein transglycosylase A